MAGHIASHNATPPTILAQSPCGIAAAIRINPPICARSRTISELAMSQFDWSNLDAAEDAAGAGTSMNKSTGGQKHQLGGDRPPAQGTKPPVHMSDADKGILLRQILNAHGSGMVIAWLEDAVQTHRFSPPERKDSCGVRELMMDTRKHLFRAVHPDKIPQDWKESKIHYDAVCASSTS